MALSSLAENGNESPPGQELSGITSFLDGRLGSLLASMDDAGIERSVILSIATNYQDLDLDDEVMDPVFAAMEERGLIFVSHTGFDHAGPVRDRLAVGGPAEVPGAS